MSSQQECEKIRKDCLAYFHQNPVWKKALKGFREKYSSYGRFGGKVVLQNLKSQEIDELEGFFGKNFHGQKSVTVSADRFRQALEDRMAAICAQVSGAGEVQVIVSLQGGFEYVYAYDEKVSASGTSRVYVTIGSGSSQRLVFLTEKAPAITGIGVVCTGGSDPTVRQEITSLLSAAFGIGTNKIYVTGRG